MSGDKLLGAGGTPSVALSVRRGTVALLLAALVGLTTFFFLSGGGGGIAYAQGTITAKVQGGHECNAEEWHFVITQIDQGEDAPAFITVSGPTAIPNRFRSTRSRAGRLTTSRNSNLDSTVVSATADIYEGWAGSST